MKACALLRKEVGFSLYVFLLPNGLLKSILELVLLLWYHQVW